jgi:hypothetical protein
MDSDIENAVADPLNPPGSIWFTFICLPWGISLVLLGNARVQDKVPSWRLDKATRISQQYRATLEMPGK